MSYVESSVNYSTYDGFNRARHQQHSSKSATLSSYSSDRRNKYNTLTPIEAKKLAKFLNVRAPPVRTASVLHKPRPPPLVSQLPSETDCDLEFATKISDESYASAKSHQSDTSNNLKSLSKLSLSSSTSKVFQNHLCNLKKFFRHMPMRRSFMNNNTNNIESSEDASATKLNVREPKHQTLSESVSQLCLDRSQSPTTFSPPPPVDLKSMIYMESNVNYSNYDEFTRARNQRSSTLLSCNNNRSRNLHKKQQPFKAATDNQAKEQNNFAQLDYEQPWQLMSLPVSFERNLATVLEEKQNLNDSGKSVYLRGNYINNNTLLEEKLLIKPPANFDDQKNDNSLNSYETNPKTSSSQSLTSIATADSVLDFYQPPVNSYRFSYAQQTSFEPASRISTGLPPKIPNGGTSNLTPGYDTTSSSSIMNETSNCDERISLEGERKLANSQSENNATNLDIELDSTIISDNSTLYGDSSNNTTYVSKCAELEQQVNCLRNKLLSKDKELTDLQLKQWSADFLIDQLKANISRLEKENSQLKANFVSYNRAKC